MNQMLHSGHKGGLVSCDCQLEGLYNLVVNLHKNKGVSTWLQAQLHAAVSDFSIYLYC